MLGSRRLATVLVLLVLAGAGGVLVGTLIGSDEPRAVTPVELPRTAPTAAPSAADDDADDNDDTDERFEATEPEVRSFGDDDDDAGDDDDDDRDDD